MPIQSSDPARQEQRPLPETRPKMLKATLRNAETDEWRERIGRAVQRLQRELSLKEFAALVQRDERQVARWFTGVEHAQLAAIFAVERFRQPLIVALSELAGAGVEIETTIRIRRTA